MPGFVIFVLVLTFAYVVYFSVMMTFIVRKTKRKRMKRPLMSAVWIMKKCQFPWKNIIMVLKVVT